MAEPEVKFNRDIRPILSNNCFACHGPGESQADLRLDTFEGATEWAVTPGDASESEILARITSDDPELRMPPLKSKKPALNDQQIDLLKKWIDQGAEYEPHWSYLQATRPEVEKDEADDWSKSPIDRLLRKPMKAAGAKPSAEADRVTLVRRLYLDVTGLPPTPAQVDAFLADKKPGAYERLVDELLASPRYAERMATWWFDLVRFANTVGYHGDQHHNITPYRDYVLKSFHENLPFDQFTKEQLAGDLLPPSGDKATDTWRLIATGYNRVLQSSHEGGIQDKEYRAKMLADRVRNVSEVWLGSSMGCAECHDHKFDPFTTKDFYAMEAFFADVDRFGSFQPIGRNELVTNRPPEIYTWTLPLFNEMQKLDKQIAQQEKKFESKFKRWGVEGRVRHERQKLMKLRLKRLELEASFVPTMVTQAVEPRTIRVLPKGNWQDDSGEVVAPNMPEFLTGPPPEDRRLTRLDLAEWLVSSDNPLTARVVMNRLWKQFYGVGVSPELLDVGSQGEWPTNPELLDWLATEFIGSGWDVKHMVRLMVTSSVYRQSSLPREDLEQIDPGNELLARQNRFRLEAEQIRDTALSAAGLLVHKLGGDTAKPYQPAGYYAQLNFPVRKYKASRGKNLYRRSVYTHWQRQYLHPAMRAFDAPSREECTAQRPISSTPSAALVLLNDPEFVEAMRGLATRLLTTHDVAKNGDAKEEKDAAKAGKADQGAAPMSDDERLRWAWREVTSRAPNDDEVAVLTDLLGKHRQHYAADKDAAIALLSIGASPRPKSLPVEELAAWTSVCRVLMNLSESIVRN